MLSQPEVARIQGGLDTSGNWEDRSHAFVSPVTLELSSELRFLTRSVIGAAGEGSTGYQTPPSSLVDESKKS